MVVKSCIAIKKQGRENAPCIRIILNLFYPYLRFTTYGLQHSRSEGDVSSPGFYDFFDWSVPMRVFFPVIFSMIVIAILSGVEIVLLRILHREWWRYSWVRNLSYGIPLLGLFSLIAWVLGIILDSWLLTFTGATTTAAVFVFGVALMLSLPFSGIFHMLDRLIHVFQRSMERKRGEGAAPVSQDRRAFLRASAATFPVLAVTAGGSGLVASFQEPKMPVIPLVFRGLPEALEGFRILHLSDVHTGFFIGLENLEQMAERSAQQQPDLILLTGDFSDDREAYGDALHIVGQIPSRYGIYASIGNHEYFRGIKSIIRSYEKSTVPLLLDEGAEIIVDGQSLFVGGADDPRSLSAMPEHFFEHSVDRAMAGA